MAKTSSKYFASVITKLLAAKRSENITIDESFKTSLRSGLMMKAGGESYLEKDSTYSNFLSKWKYAFALVPTTLVIMIVAAKVMDMQVSVPSDVIVPVATEENVQESDENGDLETSILNKIESESESEDFVSSKEDANEQKKLVTVPGELVMPSSLKNDVENVDIVSEVVATDVSVQSGNVDISDSSSYINPWVYDFGVAAKEEKNDGDDSHREEKFQKEAVELQKIESELVALDRVDEPKLEKISDYDSLQVEEGDMSEQIDDLGDQGGAGVDDVSDLGGGDINNEPVLELPESIQLERVGTHSNFVLEPVSMDRYSDAGEELKPRILYTSDYNDTNLSDIQVANLIKTVVPNATDGRGILHVEVDNEEANIIDLTIYLQDGSIIEEKIMWNESRGVWDYVKYVTNSGYDSNLSYTTYNFQY